MSLFDTFVTLPAIIVWVAMLTGYLQPYVGPYIQ